MDEQTREGFLSLKKDYESGCCPACKAGQGKNHESGCDWEECPICHAQMIACNCDIPTFVGMSLSEARAFEDTGKLLEPYAQKWESILNEKGLVPWGSEQRLKVWIQRHKNID